MFCSPGSGLHTRGVPRPGTSRHPDSAHRLKNEGWVSFSTDHRETRHLLIEHLKLPAEKATEAIRRGRSIPPGHHPDHSQHAVWPSTLELPLIRNTSSLCLVHTDVWNDARKGKATPLETTHFRLATTTQPPNASAAAAAMGACGARGSGSLRMCQKSRDTPDCSWPRGLLLGGSAAPCLGPATVESPEEESKRITQS